MMQIAILNGVLSEAEQEFYIRHITKKYPANLVEKIILDVRCGCQMYPPPLPGYAEDGRVLHRGTVHVESGQAGGTAGYDP